VLGNLFAQSFSMSSLMPLGTEVNIGPGNVVLDGVAAPPPKRGTAPPQFLIHVYCGQMTGWMKPPLGTKVDLGPGYIVLDRNPAPPEKGAQQHPLFSTHVYCGHGRPSQLLLSSCNVSLHLTTWTLIFSASGLPSDDKMNRMEKLLEMTTWRK